MCEKLIHFKLKEIPYYFVDFSHAKKHQEMRWMRLNPAYSDLNEGMAE